MPQKTAVEWLIRNVNENIVPMYIPKEVTDEAKEMERDQILQAYNEGYDQGERLASKAPAQYYNETYKK